LQAHSPFHTTPLTTTVSVYIHFTFEGDHINKFVGFKFVCTCRLWQHC